MERLRPISALLLIALLLLGGAARDGWHVTVHADDAEHAGHGPVLSESCSLCSDGLPTALSGVPIAVDVPVLTALEVCPSGAHIAHPVSVRVLSDRGPPSLG